MAKSQNDRAVIDLVINGNQSQTSLKEIALAATATRSALLKMKEADDPAAYKAKIAEYQKLAAAHKQVQSAINGTTSAWQKYKANAVSSAVGLVGGNLFGTAVQAAIGAIPAAITRFRQFDAASADMSANLGLAAKDVDYFNKKAQEMGPVLGKSAAEVLEGFKLVGSANSDLVKTPTLLADVTQQAMVLSQASKMTLADATASLVGSMNQFDAGADQAQRFINVMAGGAQVGSAEISDMAASLKASGIVANQTGLSFEQTNGALQSLSKESLKGEQAGTMLRNILLTLGAGANETNPKVVGLEKALDNLAKKNLSTAEVTKLFGKENVTAALSLINHRDRVAEFTKGLTGTTAAYDMAAKNAATLDFQISLFSAQVDKAALWLGTKLVPAFTSVVKGGTDFLTLLPKLGSWLEKNGEWLLLTGIPGLIAYNGTLIKATAAAAANTIAEGYRRAAYQAGFAWLVISETATKAYAFATGVLTGQISLQTAVVTVARNIWAAFNAVLLLNPIGLVVAAMGGLIAAMKYFGEHTKAALDLEQRKVQLQRQSAKDTKASADALKDLNEKVSHFNELSKAEQEELKKTIALKEMETKARLASAYARAREVARAEGNKPNFWQGVKQGATDFVTGNWGSLYGEGLEKRRGQQEAANKASAYADAKQLFGVDQLKADLEQMDHLLDQVNTKKAKVTGGKGGLTDDQKKAAKDLEKMLADSRKRIMEGEKSDYEKEVAAFAEHYSEMYDLAKGNKDKIEEIERLSLIEFAQIDKRRLDQERKTEEKRLKDVLDSVEAELTLKKKLAQFDIDMKVASGKMSKAEGEKAKLEIEKQHIDALEIANRAYFKALEDLNKDSAKRLIEIERDKVVKLLEIDSERAKNKSDGGEIDKESVAKAYKEDQEDLESARQKSQNDLEKRYKKGLINETEYQISLGDIETEFLKKKLALQQQHYDAMAELSQDSAEQQKQIERDKNKDLLETESQLTKAEQTQYEGRLGAIIKFLDKKKKYFDDATTIMKALFAVDENKASVGPLLDELDQLKQKTNLTSSEQERMAEIVKQVGSAMPEVVTSTNQYGTALAINTEAARKEVEAQKKRAKVLQAIAIAEKALAVARIGISYGIALMGAIQSASGIPFPANLGAIAASMLPVTLEHGAALASVLSANTSQTPAFADGGYTGLMDMAHPGAMGASGFYEFPTLFNFGKRSYIAGEAGREFIISNRALQQPVVANFARMLDVAQKSGNFGIFTSGASGGSQTMSASTPSPGLPMGGMSTELGLAILQQLQRNNQLMEKYATRPIVNNYRLTEQYQKEIQQIRNDNKLGFTS